MRRDYRGAVARPRPSIDTGQNARKEATMSVARVTEISATSEKSFEDALNEGISRATKTLRNVRSAWIKEQSVVVEGERIVRYQVNMLVTFVLDE
jgi:flavin-binding protein dodecin